MYSGLDFDLAVWLLDSSRCYYVGQLNLPGFSMQAFIAFDLYHTVNFFIVGLAVVAVHASFAIVPRPGRGGIPGFALCLVVLLNEWMEAALVVVCSLGQLLVFVVGQRLHFVVLLSELRVLGAVDDVWQETPLWLGSFIIDLEVRLRDRPPLFHGRVAFPCRAAVLITAASDTTVTFHILHVPPRILLLLEALAHFES